MMRKVILWLFFLALPAAAQQSVEVIPLRHQTVDQVIPALQPLVEPGGSLSGMNSQLFLRASPRNRQEIKAALAAIDVPLRRLVIHVSRNRAGDDRQRGAAASGQVILGSTRRAEADARVWDTHNARSDAGNQMVQTVEGGRAFIQAGSSLPVPLRQVVVGPGGAVVRDTVVYRDIGQGFYAEPHVNGDRVTLEISQQADSPGRYGPGSTDVQRLTTTVTGRLGEWIELGGSGRQQAGDEGNGWSRSTSEVRDSRSIWLMVEEIR